MTSTRTFSLVWTGTDKQHMICYRNQVLGVVLDMGFHPDRVSCTYLGARGRVRFLERVDLTPSDYVIAERYYLHR